MLKNFNRENIEVGTTLFLVPAHLKTAKPQLITINKVGRKFAYFGVRGKIDLDTLSVVSEGSGTPTKVQVHRHCGIVRRITKPINNN